MIDRFRQQIEARLHEITTEADQLREALAALARNGRPAATSEAPPRARAPRRARRIAPAATATTSAPPSRRRRAGGGSSARTARGATKAAVLAALGGGEAMTASEVAAKAGLGRATVSTTLSKLATSGEVRKAIRGYQLAPPK